MFTERFVRVATRKREKTDNVGLLVAMKSARKEVFQALKKTVSLRPGFTTTQA